MFRRRAFTLLEAMVALAVGSAMLAGVTGLVIYALRSLNQFVAYNEVQQQLLFATRCLQEDLSISNSASLDVGTADLCILGSPYDLRATSDNKRFTFVGTDLAYRTWVCYYRTGAGELRRAEQSMGGSYPNSALPLAGRPALVAFSALPAVYNRTVARYLTEFKVSPTTTAGVVQLFIRVDRNVDSTHKTELYTTTQLRVLN